MIIGISGPAGAGKDTAASYITQRLGIEHISGGDVLRNMLSELGLKPTKNAVSDFGTFLRQHYGADFIIRAVIAKTQNADDFINSGLRTVEECQIIQANGGKVMYIEAPSSLRYQRITNRNRGGEQTDIQSLQKQDEKEANAGVELAENLNAVRSIADDIVMNDASIEALREQLEVILKRHGLLES